MRRLMNLACRWPWLTLLLLGVVTWAMAAQLSKLRVDVSTVALASSDDPAYLLQQQVKKTYGEGGILLVAVSAADTLRLGDLRPLRELHDSLAALPFVSRVDSLFSVKDLRQVGEELKPVALLDPLPSSQEKLDKVLAEALLHPFMAGTLISQDLRTIAFNLHLDAAKAAAAGDQQVVSSIELLLEPLRARFPQALALGQEHVRAALSESIRVDQGTLLPLSMLALLVALLFLLGRPEGLLAPLLTAGGSVVWTLGLMSWMGLGLNVATSIVPALLVIIGSTEDIHLLAAYLHERGKGADPRKAREGMILGMSTAVTLTFVTTYLGFLSFAVGDLDLMQEFGVVASTGMAINFLITVLTVPALLAILGPHLSAPKPSGVYSSGYRILATSMHRLVGPRPRQVMIISALILVVSVVGMSRLQVDTDDLDYLGHDADVAKTMQAVQSSLSGIQTLELVLSSRIEGTFQKVRYLTELVKLQDFLKKDARFDRSYSLADLVMVIDRALNGDPMEELLLPDEDALVREYMLFVSRDTAKPLVNKNFSETRILVRHSMTSSAEIERALADIRAFADKELDAGLELRMTGPGVLAVNAANALAQGQIESVLMMLAAIFIIVGVLFAEPRAGLVAVMPNLLPIALLFGVMGFIDVSLNTGTTMVAAIAIGICVDDTMHFIVRYNQEKQCNATAEAAVLATMQEEARPIIATSLALSLGFAVLLVSEFPPVANFAALSILVILVAMLSNFLLMPVLLMQVRLLTLWDQLGVELRDRLFTECRLFHGMGRWEVHRLIAMSGQQSYEDSDWIVRRGDEGRELFVLLEGEAEVCIDNKVVAQVHPGEVFGELALVADAPRTADVRAKGPVRAMVLQPESLERVRRLLPRTAAKLNGNLARVVARRFVKA